MSSLIQDLIAKKNYPKAIDAINAELKKRPRDPRLRMQQADTLILANRNREAIPILMSLADDQAKEGFTDFIKSETSSCWAPPRQLESPGFSATRAHAGTLCRARPRPSPWNCRPTTMCG